MHQVMMEFLDTCAACGSKGVSADLKLDDCTLFRCSECRSLHFPQTVPRGDARHYHREETAELYGSYYDNLRKKQSSIILKALKGYISPPARLLDVGCGNGTFVEMARIAGYEAEGIDVSLPPINHQHAAGHLSQKSMTELIEEGQNYSVVTVLNVLEHVKNPRSFLQAIALLAESKRGIVVFALPLSTGLIYQACRIVHKFSCGLVSGPWRTILQWHLPSPHVFLPSLQGLRSLMVSTFGSAPFSVAPQVIVDGANIGQRVDLERVQREVGMAEAVALYAAGLVFSAVSRFASRIDCPDEVFFFVRNEK